jgi:membrane associated rhomboid family serine protease
MNFQEYRPGGFGVLPPVVKNLLIINVLGFLGYFTFGYVFNWDLNDKLGLHYFMADKFSPFQYVSYMFMHGGIGHIFFNMFALWMFGNALENYWGGKRFLTYYLITGVGAGLVHTLVNYYHITPIIAEVEMLLANPNSINPSQDLQQYYSYFVAWGNTPDMELFKQWIYNRPIVVGASGAVFGLLLAFGMLFPNALIYIYFAIPIKAKYFVLLYGALELYSGIQNNPGDNVAHFAHLGGMLFGFFLIKFWKRNPGNH